LLWKQKEKEDEPEEEEDDDRDAEVVGPTWSVALEAIRTANRFHKARSDNTKKKLKLGKLTTI
jgi:hypothetical protein